MGPDCDLAPRSSTRARSSEQPAAPHHGRKSRKSHENLRLVGSGPGLQAARPNAAETAAALPAPPRDVAADGATQTAQECHRLIARLRAENFALRQQLEQLTIFRHLALRDELTGLHNRRSLEESLRREWSRTQRCLQPMAVLSIDLDEFKPINDCFGHAVGDGVLRWFAQQLLRACREVDVVCRVGGDEFVILLPATDRAGAEIMGERLERLVEQATDAPRLPGEASVRFSWGAASLDDGARSPTELLIRADEAMYRHKRRRATAALGKVAAA